MAVPGPNVWTPTGIESAFLAPISDPVYDPLSMRATGGVAIGDGSQGREVQFWTISYDGANINVNAAMSASGDYVLPVAGVLTVCGAFDSNMAVALAYQKADGSYLYFFNGLHNAYETLHVAEGTSCRVVVDKTAQFFSGQSDVIFIYTTLTDTVLYRIQRDRYVTAYTASSSAHGELLARFGPNTGNRLQYELRSDI